MLSLKVPAVHAEGGLHVKFLDLGVDLLDQLGRAVGCVRISAVDISAEKGFELIAEGELI